MQASRAERDDLTKITGIGPTRQLWLAEVFGVRTYGDLAALLVDDIEAQLKAESKPYSRSEIELWPQEAATLAARTKMVVDQNSAPAEPEPTDMQAEKTGPENKALEPNTGEGQWQQVAYFNVAFLERREKGRVIERKTTINYHEADENDEWDRFDTEQIGPWILEQAGNKLRQEIQEAPAVEPEPELMAEAAPPVRLPVTLTDLRLYQPAGAQVSLASGKNAKPYAGVIQAGHPFAVEADFELGEKAATVIGKREIPYRAQFYTLNRSTRDKAHLGDAEPGLLVGGKAGYSAMLSGIALPAGTFRLQVAVIAESENVAPGYLELPMLRVR